jgi:hypothetical protein
MHEAVMVAEPSNAKETGGAGRGNCSATGLSYGPLDRLLVENPATGSTHLLLDLVRDAGTLQQHMNTLCDVLVNTRGPLRSHLVSG